MDQLTTDESMFLMAASIGDKKLNLDKGKDAQHRLEFGIIQTRHICLNKKNPRGHEYQTMGCIVEWI